MIDCCGGGLRNRADKAGKKTMQFRVTGSWKSNRGRGLFLRVEICLNQIKIRICFQRKPDSDWFSMVGTTGLEPATPCVWSKCSPSWAKPPYINNKNGGEGGIRTHGTDKVQLISSQSRYDHFDTSPLMWCKKNFSRYFHKFQVILRELW